VRRIFSFEERTMAGDLDRAPFLVQADQPPAPTGKTVTGEAT
jgi:hypothetical protein